jgi:hypothetical protein
MLFVANDPIIALVLPELAAKAEHLIDLARCVSLPTVRDPRKRLIVFVKRSDNEMDVMRHNDGASKLVSLTIKVSKGIGDNLARVCVAQTAASCSFVKPSIDTQEGLSPE